MQSIEMGILQILSDDARTTADEIAKMLGKETEDVSQTIARLEKQRVIVKYPALINWEKTDIDQAEAFIEVRVTPQRGLGFDFVAEQIYHFEEVTSVVLMSGSFDLAVTANSRSIKQLALFVAEKLSTIDGVLSTNTHFVLKTYKTRGVIMEGAPSDDRLMVSP